VASLPSLTRNIYDFVALSGNVSGGDNSTNMGASITSNSGQNVDSQGVGYSINGQRETGTEILLDGVENINIFGAVVGDNPNGPGTIGRPTQVVGLKGGLNTFATGANHDERRFGQFSLRFTF
jgi:hypothetical protein